MITYVFCIYVIVQLSWYKLRNHPIQRYLLADLAILIFCLCFPSPDTLIFFQLSFHFQCRLWQATLHKNNYYSCCMAFYHIIITIAKIGWRSLYIDLNITSSVLLFFVSPVIIKITRTRIIGTKHKTISKNNIQIQI